jgi:hypothetical protein
MKCKLQDTTMAWLPYFSSVTHWYLWIMNGPTFDRISHLPEVDEIHLPSLMTICGDAIPLSMYERNGMACDKTPHIASRGYLKCI